MIFVIATIELAPGKRDEFLKHFHEIVPQVLNETGCIEYAPTVDVSTNIAAQDGVRADVVTIIEKWADIDALEMHLVAEHMVEYRKKVSAHVQSASLQIVEPA